MQRFLSVILVGIMSLSIIDCVTKKSESDSAKGQPPPTKLSNEVAKTKTEPPETIPQAALGPASGAELVDPDKFHGFVMQVCHDFCLKMTGDEPWILAPDAPWKERESRRNRFINLPAKSEFETNAQYEERVKKWRVVADEAIEAYRREFSAKFFTTYFKVVLGSYDADRGVFASAEPQFTSIYTHGSINFERPGEIAVPIEEAKRWRQRDQQLRLRVDYHIDASCGPSEGKPSLKIVSWKLVFADTGEIIWSKGT